MEKKRSVGGIVYSITIILYGLWMLFLIFPYLIPTIISKSLCGALMMSLVLLVFPIVCIVIGVGLLRLENRVRLLVFISVIILIVGELLAIIHKIPTFYILLGRFRYLEQFINIWDEFFILTIILFIPALFFFTRPEVKERLKLLIVPWIMGVSVACMFLFGYEDIILSTIFIPSLLIGGLLMYLLRAKKK